MEKQYYRVNNCSWYMMQNGDKYEALTAYKTTARIETTKGDCMDYNKHAGCSMEPISEASYNRVRRWVLNKIMSHV